MTLQSIIDGAREFVGKLSAAELFRPIDRVVFDSLLEDLTSESVAHAITKRELESERAARQKAEAELASETFACHGWVAKCKALEASVMQVNSERQDAREKLTSALETIDALTRWRLQSEEPCPQFPVEIPFDMQDEQRTYYCRADSLNVPARWNWRFTPESWEAARKAGTDAGTL